MDRYGSTCCALIKQIDACLEKQANQLLRNEDLTLTQVSVLVDLDQAEEKTRALKDLERKFSVAQPTMLGVVCRLEQKGLVETFNSATDRRRKLVRLTGAGQDKCGAGYRHMDSAEELLLQALDGEERVQFRQMLERVRLSFS